MFYLKEMSYSFDMAEYNFIKSIPADENGYTNDFYNISMEEFVSKALPYFKDSHNGTNLKDGYVPETFFLMINDGTIIGQVRIRHYLTEELKKGAGHIGYYIAPQYRGKGFGKSCLRLAITYAYQFVKEDVIYLRLQKSNEASLKVQLANGAVIDHEDENHIYTRITKQPTCTEPGDTTYTSAVFNNTSFTVQAKTLTDVPALGHSWGEPSYTWAEDNCSIFASRICSRDLEHVQTETVAVNSEITKQPTCTEPGNTTYTSARFYNKEITNVGRIANEQ